MLDELDLFDETSDSRGRHRRYGTEGGAGRSALTLFITLLILGSLIVGGWVGFLKVRDFLTPPDFPGPGHGKVTVVVNSGDVSAQIGNELYSKGVVASAGAFVDAAKNDDRSRNIQPGAYQLKKEMRAKDALAALLDPKSKLVAKITVPEGHTNYRIYKSLAEKLDIPVEDFTKLDKRPEDFGIDDSWFVRTDDKKAVKSLEGFLYPSTYEFDPDTTAAQAIQKMVDKFLAVAKELDLKAVAEQKGITAFEAMIVGSLIEAEVIPKDLPKAARVVYNRLEDTSDLGRLRFDSSTNYWLEKQGKKRKESSKLTTAEMKDPDNPYSTHAHSGLPPGPIANPSSEAMKAATNPAKGDWLYFVLIEEDGTSAFAETLEEHNRNVDKCRARDLGC